MEITTIQYFDMCVFQIIWIYLSKYLIRVCLLVCCIKWVGKEMGFNYMFLKVFDYRFLSICSQCLMFNVNWLINWNGMDTQSNGKPKIKTRPKNRKNNKNKSKSNCEWITNPKFQPTTKMKPKSMCTQIDLLRRKALMLISIAVKYHRYMYNKLNGRNTLCLCCKLTLHWLLCRKKSSGLYYRIKSEEAFSGTHNGKWRVIYTMYGNCIIIIIITIWEYTMFNVTKANSYWLKVEARNGLNLAITWRTVRLVSGF